MNFSGPSQTRTFLAGALVAVMALAGSTPDAGAAVARHGASTGPIYGGTLHIAYSANMVTFDPTQAFFDDWWFMMGTLYNGLYQMDGQGKPQLDLAAVPPTISPDRKVWTFHLRKGVLFHNGMEVTADDLKFSIMRTLSPHTKPAVSWGQPADTIFVGAQDFVKGSAKDVSGMQVLDRYTIRFVLAQPVAVFPYLLASSFNFVVPKAVVQKEGDLYFANHPIGTGPFMLQSWQKGVRVVVVRNPHYFHAGKPYLDKIIADTSVAPNIIALKVEKGDLDGFGISTEIAASDLQQAQRDSRFATYLVRGPTAWVTWMDVNVHAVPLNSPELRQAIALAINHDRLVRLLGGQAYPAHQLYFPIDPQYDPQLEQHPVYGYDLARAKALVKASGYHGQLITILYASDYTFQFSAAPGVQQDLRQIGLNVTLRGVTATSLGAIQASLSGHQISFNQWSPDYADGYDYYQGEIACGVSVAGGESGAHDCLPAADALVAKAEGLPLGPERDALLRQAEVLALRRASRIPLVFLKVTNMVSPRVGGYYWHSVFGWQFENYWLKH